MSTQIFPALAPVAFARLVW